MLYNPSVYLESAIKRHDKFISNVNEFFNFGNKIFKFVTNNYQKIFLRFKFIIL